MKLKLIVVIVLFLINYSNSLAQTSLIHIGVEQGKVNFIIKGLKHGDDIEARDNEGFTPLLKACIKGELKVIKLLIEKGANLNARTDKGMTPLMFAARYMGSPDAIRLLIEKGADIHTQADDGRTLMVFAIQRGITSTFKQLIETHGLSPSKKINGLTPLMWACRARNEQAVRYLINKGVDINDRDSLGRNALYHMTYTKDYVLGVFNNVYKNFSPIDPIIDYLIDAGADINTKASDGTTPIVNAFKHGATACESLLKYEPDITVKDENGNTLLMLAAKKEIYADYNQWLLGQGIDPSIKNKDGETALIIALKNSNHKMLKTLLVNNVFTKDTIVLVYDSILLDTNMEKVHNSSGAKYLRNIVYHNGKYQINDILIENKQLAQSIQLSSIFPEYIYDGNYTSYHETGNKKLEGIYYKGIKHGLFMSYESNGDKSQLLKYSNNENGYKICQLWDNEGKASLVKGTGSNLYTSENNNVSYFHQVKDSSVVKAYTIRHRLGDTIYSSTTTRPEYEGGMANFRAFISQNLKYPQEASDTGIEGKVYVEFIIDNKGEVSDLTIIKGIGAGCDEASVKLIESTSGNWIPARDESRKVKSKVILPVTFKL